MHESLKYVVCIRKKKFRILFFCKESSNYTDKKSVPIVNFTIRVCENSPCRLNHGELERWF